MRKVVVLAAVIALTSAGIAFAGDYHYKGTLNCNECHVMHGSQQHGYNADGTGTTTPIGGAGPYQWLLRNEPNALCLSCHDNQTFAPDVLEANGGTAPTLGRQAGGLNEHNTAPYFDGTGHTLGSTATAPGGTFANPVGLECIDCHSPHGRGGSHASNPYRNLYVGGNVMSYAVTVNDLTKDVFERASGGTDHYDIGNVDFNEPKSDSSYYGQFCKACHTNFHGKSTDANMAAGGVAGDWIRHPTADVNIGSGLFDDRAYRVKVMSPTGNWGTQGTALGATMPTDLTPSCFTCHKAHGNQRAFGLVYPDSAGVLPIGEEGSGARYRDLCRDCHARG
ncbi:MAG: hypothetical protein HZB43_05475 [candidate division Zixibacteria bacterium]|nr:hypothetical protein [candidate division Zixibacteria bacterium]